ncbi:hypothetical protein P805_03989 [Serratia marcescens BIDMC 44]|uniref:hypothetical protein n=1 Tax=Serratia marcescens TaxID=615 RepID=UPI00044B9B3C|nr:hypothetical protein [Serratia marcescens]ETX38134.1 hypothetical protein P805_03989 [Serratia marcescens BIDMC 44]
MKKTLSPLPQPQPQAEAQATAPLSYPVRVHNAVSRELRLPEHARGGAARAVSADGQRHRVCAVQRRGARFRSLKM